jgi:uncharacterized membrane protein YcjF (UPF0283 family)
MRIEHVDPGWADDPAQPGRIQPSHVVGLGHAIVFEPGDADGAAQWGQIAGDIADQTDLIELMQQAAPANFDAGTF